MVSSESLAGVHGGDLRWWADLYTPGRAKGRRQRLLQWLILSKVAHAACVAETLQEASQCFLAASLDEAMPHVILLLAMYVILVAHHVVCSPGLTAALRLAADHRLPEDDLPPDARRDVHERVARTARRSDRFTRFYALYSLYEMSSIIPITLFGEPRWDDGAAAKLLGLGEAGTVLSSLLRQCLVVPQALCYASGLALMYSLWPCLLFAYTACADLSAAVGRGLQESAYDRGWADTQMRVLRALMSLRSALFKSFLSLMVMPIVLPLLATVEVVASGAVEAVTLITLLYVLTLFVPMCMAGETLSQAWSGVAEAAYAGPWPEETVAQRRARLQAMCAAGTRGALAGGLGLGRLDMHSCGEAMRNWFKCLQLLLNLRGLSA